MVVVELAVHERRPCIAADSHRATAIVDGRFRERGATHVQHGSTIRVHGTTLIPGQCCHLRA